MAVCSHKPMSGANYNLLGMRVQTIRELDYHSFQLNFTLESIRKLTLSGQPNMEKGNRPEENHVSNTSSSAT